MSPFGTKRTRQASLAKSAYGSKSDAQMVIRHRFGDAILIRPTGYF